MFRASSAHLQEDILVVYKQHMVPSLSIRVLVVYRYAARFLTLDGNPCLKGQLKDLKHVG